MKIRSDFVTNSSSSSYVAIFDKLPEFDADTLKKYPILDHFEEIFKVAVGAHGECEEYSDGELNIYDSVESLKENAYAECYDDVPPDTELEEAVKQYEWSDEYDLALVREIKAGKTALSFKVAYDDYVTGANLEHLADIGVIRLRHND